MYKMLAGLVDFRTLTQLSKQTFSTLSEIEIISFSFLQCIVCYCFCNSNIFYIDKVYESHFCLTVKNQRHDMAGINDCENLGMVKF